MKEIARISIAGSHLIIGLVSILGALLVLNRVPEQFDSLRGIMGDIYFSDTVFDHFSQLFLLGIVHFFTMTSSFYGFRLWQVMSIGTACCTLLFLGKVIEGVSFDYGAIFFVLCMFQLLMSLLFILQMFKSRAETD